MVETIRNPLVWGSDQLRDALSHAEAAGGRLGGARAAPEIRRLEMSDLREVLAEGVRDLGRCRSDAVFAVLLYPVIGLLAAWFAADAALLPLLFPAAAGFALVGPAAAVGVYEMSRRLEQGAAPSWRDALKALGRPAIGAILALGAVLAGVFGVWMLAAQGIHAATLGPEAPEGAAAFAEQVVTTGAGWAMIAVGMGVGFCFAAAVLAASWLAFPMLVDRDVGVPMAVTASLRAARANPRAAAAWGLIVAAALALGSAPLFLGLIVVLPALGHATWRLYRRAVAWPEG